MSQIRPFDPQDLPAGLLQRPFPPPLLVEHCSRGVEVEVLGFPIELEHQPELSPGEINPESPAPGRNFKLQLGLFDRPVGQQPTSPALAGGLGSGIQSGEHHPGPIRTVGSRVQQQELFRLFSLQSKPECTVADHYGFFGGQQPGAINHSLRQIGHPELVSLPARNRTDPLCRKSSMMRSHIVPKVPARRTIGDGQVNPAIASVNPATVKPRGTHMAVERSIPGREPMRLQTEQFLLPRFGRRPFTRPEIDAVVQSQQQSVRYAVAQLRPAETGPFGLCCPGDRADWPSAPEFGSESGFVHTDSLPKARR